MERKSGWSVTLLLLALPFVLFGDDGEKPVPPAWLQNGRLVVPDYNFSISSPTPDSQWSYQDLPGIQGFKTTAFFVTGSNDRFVVIIWESGSSGPLDKRRFTEGMNRSLPKGWTAVGEPDIQPTSVPFSGSSKIKTTLRLPDDGGLINAYQYAVIGKRTYMLLTYSRDTKEPVAFTGFVSSFAFLESNGDNTSSNGLNGILLLWAIWGWISDRVYIKGGGLRSTRFEKIGLLSTIGFCIAVLIALAVFMDASPEAIGSLAALLLTVVFGVWEIRRWNIRRNKPLSNAAFVPTIEG